MTRCKTLIVRSRRGVPPVKTLLTMRLHADSCVPSTTSRQPQTTVRRGLCQWRHAPRSCRRRQGFRSQPTCKKCSTRERSALTGSLARTSTTRWCRRIRDMSVRRRRLQGRWPSVAASLRHVQCCKSALTLLSTLWTAQRPVEATSRRRRAVRSTNVRSRLWII